MQPTCIVGCHCRLPFPENIEAYEPNSDVCAPEKIKCTMPPLKPLRNWKLDASISVFINREIVTGYLAKHVPLITIVAILPRICRATSNALSPSVRVRMIEKGLEDYVARHTGINQMAKEFIDTLRAFQARLFGGVLVELLMTPLGKAKHHHGSDINLSEPAKAGYSLDGYATEFPTTRIGECPQHCPDCNSPESLFQKKKTFSLGVWCKNCRSHRYLIEGTLDLELCARDVFQEAPTCSTACIERKEPGFINVKVRYLKKSGDRKFVYLPVTFLTGTTTLTDYKSHSSIDCTRTVCQFGSKPELKVYRTIDYLSRTTLASSSARNRAKIYRGRDVEVMEKEHLNDVANFLCKRRDVRSCFKKVVKKARKVEERHRVADIREELYTPDPSEDESSD